MNAGTLPSSSTSPVPGIGLSADITLKVAALLVPISAASPAGESLRYTGVYREIADARSASSALPQGVWQQDEKRADWPLVQRLAARAITEQSKDLQLAVWLVEAWVHLDGLRGFNAGLQLLLGLHEQYLFTMHPASQDDAPAASNATGAELPGAASPALASDVVEHRANLLSYLANTCSVALKFERVSAPLGQLLEGYAFADLEEARFEARAYRMAAQKSGQSSSSAALVQATQDLERFGREDDLTPPEFFRALEDSIVEAQAALTCLDACLDESYGRENPGFGPVAEVLNAIAQHIAPRVPPPAAPTVLPIAKGADVNLSDTLPGEDSEYDGTLSQPACYSNAANSSAEAQWLSPLQPPFDQGAAVLSREEAYLQLGRIADYLEQLEPHSPVPSLLRRAIHWGSISLAELMTELMKDPNGISEFLQLLQQGQKQSSE